MGTEQSTQKERVTRDGLTQKQVERVLEQQRRIYEQRCKELLQAQTNVTANETATRNSNVVHQVTTSVSSRTRLATRDNATHQPTTSTSQPPRVNVAANTKQQTPHVPSASSSQFPRISSVVEASDNHRYASLRPPLPAGRNNFADSWTVNNSLERNSTPYSYTGNDLQGAKLSPASPHNLYPNLNNNRNSTQSPRNNNQFAFSNARSARANFGDNAQTSSNDFVFVNNKGEAGRFLPSAPAPPRDRSISRSRPRNSDDDVSCPTCNNSFGLNIFQCNSGHSSCRDCKMRSAPCGICRQLITDMRNITLEAYISERKVECANAGDGCCLVIKLADMETHLKECPFKEMQCPMPPSLGICHWRGKTSQLASHFDDVHPTQRHGDVDTELFLQNICNGNRILYYVLIGTYNFLFHLRVSGPERKIYMAVQLLGTKVSAAKWNYEIHVYNKRQPRRKYLYNDKCRSASESIDEIFKESRCAVIPLSYAMTFVNEGALVYKFYIKKEESKRDFNSNNYRGRGRGRGRGSKNL